jgi:hypothetical protein
MKKSWHLLWCILFITTHLYGQATIKECVGIINELVQESNGQLKIFKDSRFIVDEAGVNWVNNMLEVRMRTGNKLYVSRFDPVYIKEVTISPKKYDSPVGTVKVKLINYLSHRILMEKKSISSDRLEDEVFLNYLQVDGKAGPKIQAALEQLKRLQKIAQTNDPLVSLADDHMLMKQVWMSENQAAYTFDFRFASAGGCELWIYADYKKVSKNGDEGGTIMAIIPLKSIDRIVLDRKKAKPASYLMEVEKKEIRWYVFNKEKGVLERLDQALATIPLFFEVDHVDKDATVITDLFSRARKACGEGKVKFKEIK